MLHVKVDPEDEWLLEKFRWYEQDNYIRGRIGSEYILLHHVVIEPPPEGYVTDHINRIEYDCRKDNLRYATMRGNRLNSKSCDPTKAGIKLLPSGRHFVRAGTGNNRFSIGTFDTFEEAQIARDEWWKNSDAPCEYLAHNGQNLRTLELLKAYRS